MEQFFIGHPIPHDGPCQDQACESKSLKDQISLGNVGWNSAYGPLKAAYFRTQCNAMETNYGCFFLSRS